MKALFASLLAAGLAIAAVSVYAATPIAAKASFAADTGSPLPSEEDKDKDKDEKKKDG
jgi:H+/gluconate symporter-like permease